MACGGPVVSAAHGSLGELLVCAAFHSNQKVVLPTAQALSAFVVNPLCLAPVLGGRDNSTRGALTLRS
jgi:hypothetical protein